MSGKRPNILLLFTDQQRYDTIAASGYSHMLTPHLDRLVKEGTSFSRAYSPNPVCIPARHNLITGLSARYHNFAANDAHSLDFRLPVLPQILSDAGYETRAVGKMHFRPTRRHNGFLKMELMEEIPRYRRDDEYATYLKQVGLGNVQNIHGVRNLLYMVPQRSLIPEKHHGSTWVADRSIEFLRENGGKRPFFLWSSWIAPHPPFDVPDDFAELYRDHDIPQPLVSETELSAAARESHRFMDFDPKRETEYIRRARELYCSSISQVDKNIGRILDELENMGELNNTFIVFTSDHGEMLGDHGCFQKMLPYDSCARIPLVVRYPEKFRAGVVRDDFVDLNDVMPTLLDITGIEYPEERKLPGASWLDDSGKDRSFQYMEFGRGHRRWVSLRNRRFKYNYYYNGGRDELFDMETDPGETTNLLAGQPDVPEIENIRSELRERLIAYEAEWGLEGYVERGEFKKLPPVAGPTMRNGQFPVFPGNIVDQVERHAMNDFGDEVLESVRKEELVKLHRLNLEDWLANGAPAVMVEKIKAEKL